MKPNKVGVGAALDNLKRALGDYQLIALSAAKIMDRPERIQCLKHDRVIVELLADPQRR